jgi:hypothetical protein
VLWRVQRLTFHQAPGAIRAQVRFAVQQEPAQPFDRSARVCCGCSHQPTPQIVESLVHEFRTPAAAGNTVGLEN